MPFLIGVFLISFSVLVFQIVQTRILSVMAWYYLAFFGISMAMLGMTVGAVHVYLRGERLKLEDLSSLLANNSLACAISIPISLVLQFCLVTSLSVSVTTVVAWMLLTAVMAAPYVFAGIVVSLALTKSPFPVSLVYGVDLLGAALGCVSVLLLLDVLDAPSAVIVAGATAAAAGICFAQSTPPGVTRVVSPWWKRPHAWLVILIAAAAANASAPVGLRPILVKDAVERSGLKFYEKWNSFSRVMASQPSTFAPFMWGASPTMPKDLQISQVFLNIDGAAGTTMFHFDGTNESIDFLKYDLVNLAYHLPDLRKGAVIGVGGGRDLMSAHLFGVEDLVGVELNPVFIRLHERHPFYSDYSGLKKIPRLRLHVDDARSWFASTQEKFDVIQMSMIDTWAATGAGAFSLSENGLYTLEGWRAFIKALTDDGIFTVSRWYSPNNIDETGRMISLATAALLDAGVTDARPHILVAHADNIATLVLSRRPFTAEQLTLLNDHVVRLGFKVLIAPDHPSDSDLLNAIVKSSSIAEIDHVADMAYLDLSVPTDNRPFFFNQLKLSRLPEIASSRAKIGVRGVIFGNLVATAALLLIVVVSFIAVVSTILYPLRGAARHSAKKLVAAGTSYFLLIGIGFMLAEIALLQYFSVYLGHPIYSLGVCLFSLILATGVGSLVSGRINIGTPVAMAVWGAMCGGYLILLQANVEALFEATTSRELPDRVAISVALIAPLGFLLGFAFPTGMKLVSAVDPAPAPWFWGINGAAGVLASALAVMVSMNFGIDVTTSIAGVCYLMLVPVGIFLIRFSKTDPQMRI
ncbi:MAG: spermidine synthase [Panacagrimonas sp.]